MKNKIKADLIVLCKTKMHKWILILLLIIIIYSLNSVASILQTPEEGGYYSYTILSLAYLIGIIEPIGIGSLLGGLDIKSKMIEFKLTNQSKKEWLICKTFALSIIDFTVLLCFNSAGLLIDVIRKSIYGSLETILFRFFIVLFVWILWGVIGFTFSLLLESPEISLLLCMILYYGEQYIGRYTPIPIGIMWNQKSLEYHFFHSEEIPYGVVQSFYETPVKSFFFLIGYLLLFFMISCAYTNKKL